MDLAEGGYGLRPGQRLVAVLGVRGLGHAFIERVPGIAMRALAQPLGAGAAAIAANRKVAITLVKDRVKL